METIVADMVHFELARVSDAVARRDTDEVVRGLYWVWHEARLGYAYGVCYEEWQAREYVEELADWPKAAKVEDPWLQELLKQQGWSLV